LLEDLNLTVFIGPGG